MTFRRLICLSGLAVMLCAAASIAQEKDAFHADQHKSRGVKCETCHGEAEPKAAAPQKACLGCHQSLEAVAEKTKDRTPNPHYNHLTEAADVECTQCHNGHKADAPVCHQCHEGMQFKKEPAEAKKE